MEKDRIPRQGEIYQHFKDKPYQIVTVATHTETGETMVVYQALYGDYKTYVRSLDMFLSEVDKEKYPDAKQEIRFELRKGKEGPEDTADRQGDITEDRRNTSEQDAEGMLHIDKQHEVTDHPDQHGSEERVAQAATKAEQEDKVNHVLLEFLEAQSYYQKLEVVTTNLKRLNDRLINDMAAALDCIIEEGPLEKRIQELLFCLKAMCRFEDKRLR